MMRSGNAYSLSHNGSILIHALVYSDRATVILNCAMSTIVFDAVLGSFTMLYSEMSLLWPPN